jgi:hypothetical protein
LYIPLAFLGDDKDNVDCIDRIDERLQRNHLIMLRPESYMFPQDCYKDPAFRCEDHMCHASAYRNYAVECGDGSCARHVSNTCANSRDLLLTEGSLSGIYFGWVSPGNGLFYWSRVA